MRRGFTIHTRETAPAESLKALGDAEKALGKIPNLEAVMAAAPPLLKAYVQGWALFEQTNLTPAERHVVYQVANQQNGCAYCLPWHASLSVQAGMTRDQAEALRDAAPLADRKLEVLRRFCLEMHKTCGDVSDEIYSEFLGAGYTNINALEVILGFAIKVMSNYTNRFAQTPLDDELTSWRKE